MAKAKAEKKIKLQKVTFSFALDKAREVLLLGDFNNWDATAHPMINDGSGIWKKTVMIEPGKHDYKFLADGKWIKTPEMTRHV